MFCSITCDQQHKHCSLVRQTWQAVVLYQFVQLSIIWILIAHLAVNSLQGMGSNLPPSVSASGGHAHTTSDAQAAREKETDGSLKQLAEEHPQLLQFIEDKSCSHRGMKYKFRSIGPKPWKERAAIERIRSANPAPGLHRPLPRSAASTGAKLNLVDGRELLLELLLDARCKLPFKVLFDVRRKLPLKPDASLAGLLLHVPPFWSRSVLNVAPELVRCLHAVRLE